MQRIGIAASRMAPKSIFLYNFYVILISVLFSLFILVISGSTILFALIIISYIGNEIMAVDISTWWNDVLKICMVSLTVITVLFNIAAIIKNIKIPKLK